MQPTFAHLFRTHKRTFFCLVFLSVFSLTVAYATPPGSQYTAGETLDPSCAPGDTNCSVEIDTTTVWGDVTGTLSDQTDLQSALDAKESDLTFSTGLTRTVDTITNNLSTGNGGGQSVVGGTSGGGNLTLSSTSNGTKGKVILGSLSAYDEVNDRLGIGTTTPTMKLSVVGDGYVSTNFTIGAVASVGDILTISTGSSTNKGIQFYHNGATNFGGYVRFNGVTGGNEFLSIGTISNNVDKGGIIIGRDTGHVAIGTTTPAASAIFDVTSTTKGVLIPRMTTTERNAISSPATSLLVFNTITNSYDWYSGTGGQWFVSGHGGGGIASNTALGRNALAGNTIGTQNTAVGGFSSLAVSTGSYNTTMGYYSFNAGTGSSNTVIGATAMTSATSGSTNTVVGQGAMGSSTAGSNNVSIGANTMVTTTASDNVAIGSAAMRINTSGTRNSGLGHSTLYSNQTGSDNTAVGNQALFSATAGFNTAIGVYGLTATSTGTNNVGLGYAAGRWNTTASNQIFINSIDRSNYSGDQNDSPIYIQQNATVASQMITLNGNVGIGVTTPSYKLDVNGTARVQGTATFTNGTSTTTLSHVVSGNAYTAMLVNSGAAGGYQGGFAVQAGTNSGSVINAFRVINATGSSIRSGIGNMTNAQIDNAGATFVITPESNTYGLRLTNKANIQFDRDSFSGSGGGRISILENPLTNGWGMDLALYATSDTSGDYKQVLRLQGKDSAVIVPGFLSGVQGTGTNGAGTNLTIASGLGTGIGTVSDIIFQTASVSGLATTRQTLSTRMVVRGETGNVGIGVVAPAYTLQVGNSSVSGIVARFENSSGTCDINPTSSSLSCSSDETLKKNILSVDSSILDKVLLLNPVTYNWNRESDTDTTHIGFIAQEVESIFPDLVTTDTNTGLKSLNYTGLIPYTVKAVQEMNVQVQSIADMGTPNTLRENIIAWMGSVSNGIEHIFSNKITTKELCVQDDTGETCLTRTQIDALLDGQSVVPAPSSGPEEEPTTLDEVSEEPILDEPEPQPEPTPEPPSDPAPTDVAL